MAANLRKRNRRKRKPAGRALPLQAMNYGRCEQMIEKTVRVHVMGLSGRVPVPKERRCAHLAIVRIFLGDGRLVALCTQHAKKLSPAVLPD